MRILIGCEKSQEICIAFREIGHEAYSCDLVDCIGGYPQWHIKDDVLNHLNDGWDLGIFHPTCTYLTKAGCRWLFPKGKLNLERYKKGLVAKEFFLKLLHANIPMIVIENPIPHKVFDMPKETQIIQPFEYGHPFKKSTCLWLKNLPKLKPTNIVKPTYYIDKKGIRHTILNGWSRERKQKTFRGIAKAMAEQWGKQSPE